MSTVTADKPLSQCAISINAAHAKGEAAICSALEHAVGAGRLLADAKQMTGHEGWTAWVE